MLSVLIIASCSSKCFACCCNCAATLGSGPPDGDDGAPFASECAIDVAGVEGDSESTLTLLDEITVEDDDAVCS